ncbi:MAG: tetratricopeptide repeat protein [Gammaproteobacteria bacterium]|nr:tetratricopeptide repeat protein [Gammaproteobacteria bacterium]
MADHLQEEEQLEAISQWWQENRVSVIAAVVLTLGGTIGWSQYEDYISENAVAAADAYDSLLQERESGEAAEELALISAGLRESHAGETFADFASLQVAAAAVEAGNLVLARAELESVMASVELDSTLGQLVQLRLARVMAASGDEAGAVAILVQGSSSFPASYAQALGDIHLAAGREAEALLAYESAQTESLALGGQLGLVDLKVSGLSLRDADDSVEDSQ